MPEMKVSFPGGKKVDAHFNGFTIKTDQSPLGGGEGSAPQPFDLFLASIATCAGIYVKGFCDSRGLDTTGLGLTLRILREPGASLIGKLVLDIHLPEGFPEQYHKAVVRSADLCAVKQHMLQPPAFEINAVPALVKYWLFKTEPGSYSIQDLERDGSTFWDGVRNYQARNLLRDEIQPGDTVFLYHSNADPPGIVGLAKVVEGGGVDPSAFQDGHHYFDPRSSADAPRWYGVTIAHERTFTQGLGLPELRTIPGLEEMLVLRKGQRLSVQPVTAAEAKLLLKILK